MTYNTKNTVIVFAFAAMLMAAPLAIGNAYAVTGGNGEINPSCGIVEPANIDLGTITAGSTSSETKIVISTDATIAGTFEIISTDWTGVGSKATGSVVILADAVGTTVEINSHIFLGVDGSTNAGEFDTSGSITAQATALKAAIDASSQVVTEDFGADIGVVAFVSENAVLLTANVVGTGPNAITITTTNAAIIQVPSGGVLIDGATAATHMLAEQVKVTTQTQSEAAPTTLYTNVAKIALSTASNNLILSSATDPANDQDIDLYFHLDGVNTKSSQTIVLQAGIVDGDTVVIDGVTFTAETDSGTLTGAGNKFLTVGTPNTDAASLDAKIDATLNLRFTATSATDTVTVTAVNGGFDADAYTLVEVGGGVVFGDTTFNGGDEQLIALPYSGAISATFTFGTACDSS